MSNSYNEKAHPSSIYTRFNTRCVIHLFSYTDTLFKWSQMKSNEDNKTWISHIVVRNIFFMFKTSLLLLNFCLCVYIQIETSTKMYTPFLNRLRFCQTSITWLRSLSVILPLFWRHAITNISTFAAKTWEKLLWRHDIHDVSPRNWANALQNL